MRNKDFRLHSRVFSEILKLAEDLYEAKNKAVGKSYYFVNMSVNAKRIQE